MVEYNFDPFTGEPIRKEPAEQPPMEATPAAPAEEPISEGSKAEESKEAEASQPIFSAATIEEPKAEDPAPSAPQEAASFSQPSASPYEAPAQAQPSHQPSSEPTAHPTYENPVYHYAYPRTEQSRPSYQAGGNAYQGGAYGAAPAYTPPGASSFKAATPQKKEPKMVTRKTWILSMAAMLIFSLVLTTIGVYTALRLSPGGESVTGTAVIYKTAKLEDADGDKQKEALTIPQVAELVKNSVVEITTEQIVTGSFMQQYVSEGAGSGVIFTEDGYIVTNHHVIDGATNINIRLANGKEYKAKLIGSDAKSDLAVLKMEATGLTPAAFGTSSDLKVGDTVIAVGNPLGELGGTVTRGIISALDRAITIDNVTMNLLQTDTAINPGNSGGGMFNTSGQLVGVVNAKSAGEEIEGLGFAIPIDTAKKVIEDLIQRGYVTGRVDPGFVFVEIKDSMTAMMYRVSELGLYISEVEEGSDSQKAGFKSGDLVLSMEGKKVTTEAEANAIIDSKKAGETMKVTVKRQGVEKNLTLTLSEYVPEEKEQTKMEPQNESGGIGNLFPFTW